MSSNSPPGLSLTPQKRGRRWLWVTLLVVLLAAGGYAARSLWRGKSVAVVHPERGELVEKVVTTGRVLAPARVQLGTTLMGQVADVRVDEGDRVRTGDLLVLLRDREQVAAVAQARAAVQRANVVLGRVSKVSRTVSENRLIEARSALDLAEQDYQRAASLSDAGAVPQAQSDQAAQALESAKTRYATAQIDVKAAEPGGSDHLGAAAGQGEAAAALALALARLDQTRITAPCDGILLTRSVQPGDVVHAGQVLLVLAQSGPSRLSVQADEKDLAVLRLGQQGRAVADALPDSPFDARLAFIAPQVDADRGTIEVRLEVPDPPEGLRPDMTVSVNIETARKRNALLLPEAAVRDARAAKPWVLVARNGRAKRREVRLGARGDGLVEVLDGLSEKDSVLQSSGLDAGTRIQPRRVGWRDAL
ncbi:MAG: efflux RND transporter periplasmic adaptor subunit [Polyangiaceae bacterium]|nr:efflux RND transporter periplasmic adaptor subunit [Polyangiaceae bacterium]